MFETVCMSITRLRNKWIKYLQWRVSVISLNAWIVFEWQTQVGWTDESLMKFHCCFGLILRGFKKKYIYTYQSLTGKGCIVIVTAFYYRKSYVENASDNLSCFKGTVKLYLLIISFLFL